MTTQDIDRFVKSKEEWISDKLAILNERSAHRSNFTISYGSLVTYRGKQYPINDREGNRIGFDGEGFYMPPNMTPERVKDVCIQIYRLLAKRDLTARTQAFAAEMSVTPTAIKINNAKTRWGSCSAKKSLNLSWRLIMADDDVIDYIVVHELAHIIELNHSARFWELVGSILPDYRERKAKLKVLQNKLALEDWG